MNADFTNRMGRTAVMCFVTAIVAVVVSLFIVATLLGTSAFVSRKAIYVISTMLAMGLCLPSTLLIYNSYARTTHHNPIAIAIVGIISLLLGILALFEPVSTTDFLSIRSLLAIGFFYIGGVVCIGYALAHSTMLASRFRFRLRTLLLLMAIPCILLGFRVGQVKRQKEAVAWVQAKGGEVYYGYEFDDTKSPIPGAYPPGPGWLQDLVGLDYFAKPYEVALPNTSVSDLSPLADLTSLRKLLVFAHNVDDLTPLADLTQLQELTIHNDSTCDLKPLKSLKKLEMLRLEYVPDDTSDISMLKAALPCCEVTSFDPPRPQPAVPSRNRTLRRVAPNSPEKTW